MKTFVKRDLFFTKKKKQKKKQVFIFFTTKIHCSTSAKRNVTIDIHTITSYYLYIDISFEIFNIYLPFLRTVMFKTSM